MINVPSEILNIIACPRTGSWDWAFLLLNVNDIQISILKNILESRNYEHHFVGGTKMTFTSKTEGDKVTVSLEGRLDTNTSPALETELSEILKRGRLHLVLDFSKLEYISSSGLRVLLNAQKKTNKLPNMVHC